MFIIEYKGYDLIKYNEFLIDCWFKDYLDHPTHNHHILPKFMGGSNNRDNLIKLSIEDHRQSHIILADCFPENTKEYRGNICAALYCQSWLEGDFKEMSSRLSTLMKNRIISKETREKISKASKGRIHSEQTKEKMRKWHQENKLLGSDNPTFGRKLTLEQRASISKRLKENPTNGMEGKRHTKETKERISQIMKEGFETGRIKKQNRKQTEETKEKIREKNKINLSGSGNPHAVKLIDNETGQIFGTKKDAATFYNIPNQYINKMILAGKLSQLNEPIKRPGRKKNSKQRQILHIESGRIFNGTEEVLKEFGFKDQHFIRRRIAQGIFKIIEII